MIRTQGTDSTLEPAYFSVPPRSSSSPSSDIETEVNRLKIAVQALQSEVNGTAVEGYKDGLISKVEELERIVNELVISSNIKVYYDTVANWNNQPELLTEKGSIYIYSDAKQYEGQDIPRIKIGNGINLLKDLYFMDQDIVHALNNITTVTQEEKDKWNNKVSCEVEEEKIIFSTD